MAERQLWQIDSAHSSVELAVKHMMFTTVRGRFTDLSGTVEVDQGDPTRSTVNVEIGAASINTGSADRDTHLRSADFLDVESFPRITFRSRRVEGAIGREGDEFRVTGDLTIRGITKEVTLDARFEGTGKDPWGNLKAGARATTKIDRRDFGLTWNQALETGGVLVANELRVEIEVQAIAQVPVTA